VNKLILIDLFIHLYKAKIRGILMQIRPVNTTNTNQTFKANEKISQSQLFTSKNSRTASLYQKLTGQKNSFFSKLI
jgi:hypothetical protein